MRYLTAMCCAALLTVAIAPKAQADEYNKLTNVTFSGTVQVPGATLPAGTYTFKLADPESGRRVIQIWDKAASRLITTLLTRTNDRFESTDNPVVMFKETAVGEPQAVQSWFYPGERYGQEFVYPRAQAIRIAKGTHSTVLAMADKTTANSRSFTDSQLGTVNGNGDFSIGTSAQMEPVTLSAANTAQPTNAFPQSTTPMRPELPRTASQMPLMAAGAFLSLFAALALRGVRLSAR